VRPILRLVAEWCERRRARRLLAAMTARELQDIGLCEADIGEEVGLPFWRASRTVRY